MYRTPLRREAKDEAIRRMTTTIQTGQRKEMNPGLPNIEYTLQRSISMKSVNSHSSRVSIAKSQLENLEKEQVIREKAFLKVQRQQDEVDELELSILETRKQQILRKKEQEQIFHKESEKIAEQIQELNLIIQDEDDIYEECPAISNEPAVLHDQNYSLNKWLNAPPQNQQLQPLQRSMSIQGHLHRQAEQQIVPQNKAQSIQGAMFGQLRPTQSFHGEATTRKIDPIVPETRPTRTTWNHTKRDSNPFRRHNDPDESTPLEREYTQNQVLGAAFRALQDKGLKELPTFNGENVFDWPLFIGEYNRVNREYEISPYKNLARIRKALQGKARDAVYPLLNDPENIPTILNILQMNFGRKEWVMSAVMKKIQNLPTVAENDIENLRSLYSQVLSAYHTARNVNGLKFLDNPQLILHLGDKLSPFSKNEWNRHKASLVKYGDEVSIETFIRWLEGELEVGFASYNPLAKFKTQSKAPIPEKKKVMNHSDGDQRAKADTPKNGKFGKCQLCSSKDHSHLTRCDKFKKLHIDERRTTARTLKTCFNCLGYNHSASKCEKETRCKTCEAKHHSMLHKDRKESSGEQAKSFPNFDAEEEADSTNEFEDTAESEPEPEPEPFEDAETGEDSSEMEQHYANFKVDNTLLRIGLVKLYGPNKTSTEAALFDDGSQSTMMESNLADELGLDGVVSPVTYQWTGKVVKHHPDSKKVNLRISGAAKGSKVYDLRQVRTISNLSLPRQEFNIEKIMKIYPNIDLEKLKDTKGRFPRILIGSDNAGLIVPRKTFSYKDDGLQLTRCNLGWTIHGLIDPKATRKETTLGIHFASTKDNDENLEKLVEDMYKVENFGISNQTSRLSKDDERALEIMERTLSKVGNRYEIGHLYRYENIEFPESKTVALRRLHFIEKKMDSDPALSKEYCDKIENYLTKGYARKLPREEMALSKRTWYLPHFAVYNVNKPGKLRLVMDAKAKSHGVSLNDLLLKGPDFVPSLVSILWRARLKKIGFMADIAEMFHQVNIRPEDRCSQRFLWRGTRRDGDPDEYEMMAMMFGAVSSPSQAQYVKNFNARQLESTYPGVTRAITLQHYVDDYLDSTDTVEEAINLIKAVCATHNNGGFRLMKFLSNSQTVQESIPVEERAIPAESGIERVLGLKWNLNSDELITSCNIPSIEVWMTTTTKSPTKREVLKTMMSIFDPLGLAQPLIIQLKILFQDLWRKKIHWDDKIPAEIVDRWNAWITQASSTVEVKVPRYYFPIAARISAAELHTLCDASDKACCCVMYLRIEIDNQYYLSLVGSKTKVAPLKHLVVPRLELQSCVMGSCMAKTFQEEIKIPITKKKFYTDSKIVMNWLSTSERLNAYVAARVSKIFNESDTTIDDWMWIPSKMNTADLGTKEKDRIDWQHWHNGPSFLLQPDDQIQKMPELSKKESISFHEELTETIFVGVCQKSIDSLPDITRFSKFNRLIRATAYALKMAQNLETPKKDQPKELTIDVADIQRARKMWFQKVQHEVFLEEIHDLKSQGFVKRSSPLYTHSPFLSKGLLRLKGRIQDDNFEECNPIILPGKHYFTTLLIRFYHEQNLHVGVSAVINNLRQTFDIIRCREAVKKVFRDCLMCRVLRAKPRVPEMGELPIERSTPFVNTFQFTGLDYFGPVIVTVGRRHEKRWVALFTCLTTRGCHTEVVHSLSTKSAIMAIQRFMNIRGVAKKIFSDNATCFRGADAELRTFIQSLQSNEQSINDTLSIKGVEWHFIPPAAPHFGGAWERKVQSIKKGLTVALKEIYPTDEVLNTALAEVVNIVNNTPLSEVSTEAGEPRALCPNDILMGRANNTQFDVEFEESNLTDKSWRPAQVIADRFWKRWKVEVRPLLQFRKKNQDDRNYKELKVNDVVLVMDDAAKRNLWPKGIIKTVYYGPRDKKVRTVLVETPNGTYKRPTCKIILIFRPDDHKPLGLENVVGKTQ